MLVCKMDSNAANAQVTASLPSTAKTVSSGVKLFEASSMYGYVYPVSEYPIKFTSYGGNTTSVTNLEKTFVVNVGQSASAGFSSSYNYHKITLTGWNINSAVKGCIGYGYIE